MSLVRYLQEVDEISKLLKSDRPDTQTLRVAAHPAVWCAVKQALLDRELRYLALTDDLTCLYNRRGFFAAAVQQLKVASRKEQSLLLLYCDVDNLKKINDSYGHREGDLALFALRTLWNRHFVIPIFWLASAETNLLYWRQKRPPTARKFSSADWKRISKSRMQMNLVTSYRSVLV